MVRARRFALAVGLLAPLLCAPSAGAQEGTVYSGTITAADGTTTAACFAFSASAPGLLTVTKEVGDQDLLAWAHANLNRSKKNFIATWSPCRDCAIGLYGKVTGGGKKIRGDAIDEVGGTFTFKGTRAAQCPLEVTRHGAVERW